MKLLSGGANRNGPKRGEKIKRGSLPKPKKSTIQTLFLGARAPL